MGKTFLRSRGVRHNASLIADPSLDWGADTADQDERVDHLMALAARLKDPVIAAALKGECPKCLSPLFQNHYLEQGWAVCTNKKECGWRERFWNRDSQKRADAQMNNTVYRGSRGWTTWNISKGHFNSDEYVTVELAASQLGFNIDRVMFEIERGTIEGTRVLGRWFVHKAILEAAMENEWPF